MANFNSKNESSTAPNKAWSPVRRALGAAVTGAYLALSSPAQAQTDPNTDPVAVEAIPSESIMGSVDLNGGLLDGLEYSFEGFREFAYGSPSALNIATITSARFNPNNGVLSILTTIGSFTSSVGPVTSSNLENGTRVFLNGFTMNGLLNNGEVSLYSSNGEQSNFQHIPLTAPIPEPSTYALMLAGLGAVGYAARRRKRDQA